MASGLEPAIVRAVGPIVRQAAGRLRQERKLRRVRDQARPLMAGQVAETLVDELDPHDAALLARYLTSPDFEHVALQVVVAQANFRPAPREEILSAARMQLRHGLRHATRLPAEQLLGITDLVLDALLAAAKPGDKAGPDAALAANQAHLTAMAARNGELLARLSTLATCHDEARQLRSQVAALHADLRVPHTGLQRSVPWHRLYVPPGLLRQDQQAAESPVRDLLQAGRHVVVLGDPGAGKSTLAEKLAYDLAADRSGTEVPFLVVLRHLSAALLTGPRTLADHLVVAAREPHNVVLSADTVDYLLGNGRAVVILDGLDELTDIALRRRVAELIRGFIARFPTVPVLVTSRRVGYDEAPLDRSLFTTYELAAFTAEQVEAYARNWFAIDDSTPGPDRANLAESFLRESTSIEDLRSNPLLLSLLCAMYSADHYLPRLRSQIYERCALLVFERWDGMRGISRAIEFEGRVRGAVQALAWELFTGSRAELPRHRIVRILVEHLVGRGFDEDDAEAAARDFLAYCAGRAWVLAEVGSTDLEPIYGFAHRTFMEFFAAEHLVRHHPTAEGVWRTIEPQLAGGQWDVVAQLAVQLLDRNVAGGAEEVIRLALRSGAASADFCAGTLAHVSVAPAVVREVTRAAWQSAMRLPEAARFKLVIRDEHLGELDAADGPLFRLLHQCLDGNLPYVRRGLAELVAGPLDDGDPLAFLLVDNLSRGLAGLTDETRRRGWWEFTREQWATHADGHAEWCAARPWARLRDFQHFGATLERHGPLPFYLSDRVMRGASYPAALDFFRPHLTGEMVESGRRLSEWLLHRPAPWMSRARWLDEFQLEHRTSSSQAVMFAQYAEFPIPARGDHLGAFLVIALPYLEMAREGRQPALDFAHESPVLSILMKPDGHLSHVLMDFGVPRRIADFLVRWDAGEIRVLGD